MTGASPITSAAIQQASAATGRAKNMALAEILVKAAAQAREQRERGEGERREEAARTPAVRPKLGIRLYSRILDLLN